MRWDTTFPSSSSPPSPTTTQGRTQLKAGAYAYLVKPFEEDDLLDCVNRALKQQQDATQPGEEH